MREARQQDDLQRHIAEAKVTLAKFGDVAAGAVGKPAIEPTDTRASEAAAGAAATYASSFGAWSRRSANLAAIVGLPRVSRVMVTSCALSFARRRLRSAPSSASLVFCRWSIDLSISSIAVWKRREARS